MYAEAGALNIIAELTNAIAIVAVACRRKRRFGLAEISDFVFEVCISVPYVKVYGLYVSILFTKG